MIARLISLTFLVLAPRASAAELPPPAARPVDFLREIKPLFDAHCLKCHGPEKQKGGWRADVKASALSGGDNFAPNVRPGKSADSSLIHFVAGLDEEMIMPQKGDRLSAEQIGLLRAWIDQGAVWPAEADAVVESAEKHWAFQPIVRSPVPKAGANGSHYPIDAFVAAKLAEHGLTPALEADRATLARRITLLMHGLPPTPEEVAQFVDDRSPRAYEELIERVLRSPRYGERWAQHWLDVVRYADTAGYEYNNIRKNAWPYRDYVIRALNEDRPWDRMIFEQLAGDTVGEDAATGFLVTAPLPSPAEVGKEPAAIKQARYNSLDEMLQNVWASMLGLTLQCARCHNHKFDPVSTEEYYSLIACLEGVKFGERDWRGADQSQVLAQIRALEEQLARNTEALAAYPRRIEPDGMATTERFRPVLAKVIRLTITKTDRTSEGPAFDEIEIFTAAEGEGTSRNAALSAGGATATSSGAAKQLKTDDAHLNDGRYGPESLWIANKRPPAWVQIEFPQPVRVDRVVWSRDRDLERDEPEKAKYRKTSEWVIEYGEKEAKDWKAVVPASVDEDRLSCYRELTSERKRLLEELAKLGEKPRVFAGNFEQPGTTHVFLRGDPQQPKVQVRPASVAVVGRFELPAESREADRRAELARWIGSPRHPLTARVLVNRVWALHFGRGLVETPSDFGRVGGAPSHPELLDWLASEFIARGWSLKDLHRLILTSATFRQSSAASPEAARVDASSRYLWRFPPRRLEAEVIRDSVLQTAGTLDFTMGGPPVNFYLPKPDFGEYVPKEDAGRESWRRTIYLLRARGADDGLFAAFDVPDCGQVRPQRTRSTTPIQALNLFNGPFIHAQAEHLAARIRREAGAEVAAQTVRAFQLTLNRAPTARELATASVAVERDGLGPLCRALFNANEFVFLP